MKLVNFSVLLAALKWGVTESKWLTHIPDRESSQDPDPRQPAVDFMSSQQLPPSGHSSAPVHSIDPPRPCYTLPSGGLAFLGRGVDITRLDLFSSFAQSSSSSSDVGMNSAAIKGPVVNLTCTFGYEWTNSFNSKTYKVADQVWNVDNKRVQMTKEEVHSFTSHSELQQFLAATVGVTHENGMFARTHTYSSISDQLQTATNLIAMVHSPVLSSEATLLPKQELQLSAIVQKYLDNIDKDFDSDTEGYKRFIATFGTHFFSSVRFGPLVQNMFTIDRSLQNMYDRSQIETFSVESFSRWFDETLLKRHPEVTAAGDQFDTLSTRTYEVFGGRTELLARGETNEWFTTALDSPWVYGGQLVPIYDLISDERQKESVRKAVEAHLDRASVEDIESRLKVAIGKYQNSGRASDLKSIEKEVILLRQKKSIEHTLANHWVNALKYSLAAPKWWQEAEICFKYANDVPGKYCSGAKPTCAPLNQFTEMYQDWSRKQGGCQMMWGLFVPAETEAWFEETVKLCFNFSSVGQTFQCGLADHKNGEVCTVVNQYSAPLYDHTDSRTKGGCNIAWKLGLDRPDLAPTWLLNSRFCYSYKKRSKRLYMTESTDTICSLVGDYTAPFFDNSHFRASINYAENYIQWGVFDNQHSPV